MRRFFRGLLTVAVAAPLLTLVTAGATPSAASAAEECGGFSDVATTNLFCDDIAWMAEHGISTGYTDGTYRPAEPVSRAGMSAFMRRLAVGNATSCPQAPFIDVPATHQFCPDITWMRNTGVSTGYTDGTYRPAEPVSRAAMASFMSRLAGVLPPGCTSDPFIDVPRTHQFCPAIRWMVSQGITTGYPDGTFRPAATVTRGAMSAFMHRFGVDYERSFLTCTSAYSLPVAECEALQAMFTSLDGANWTYRFDPSPVKWFTTNTPCTWSGVTCANGHVTELRLSSFGARGPLPTQIGNLTRLGVLNMMNANISSIPSSFTTLSSLRILELSGTAITSLPPTFGNLTSLEELDLSMGALTSLPTSIGNLTNLKELHINASLTSLPSTFPNMSSLRILTLSLNELSSLPANMGNLTELRQLNLGDNQLTSVPASLGNLPNLENFSLYGNRLTNAGLPTSLGNLTTLKTLTLNENQLTTVPSWIGGLTNLRFLWLHDNDVRRQTVDGWAAPLMANGNEFTNFKISDGPGGNGCLLALTTGLGAWLDTLDPNWDEEPPPGGCIF